MNIDSVSRTSQIRVKRMDIACPPPQPTPQEAAMVENRRRERGMFKKNCCRFLTTTPPSLFQSLLYVIPLFKDLRSILITVSWTLSQTQSKWPYILICLYIFIKSNKKYTFPISTNLNYEQI